MTLIINIPLLVHSFHKSLHFLTYVRMDLRVLVEILCISRLILFLYKYILIFCSFLNDKHDISTFKEKIMVKYLCSLYKVRASSLLGIFLNKCFREIISWDLIGIFCFPSFVFVASCQMTVHCKDECYLYDLHPCIRYFSDINKISP